MPPLEDTNAVEAGCALEESGRAEALQDVRELRRLAGVVRRAAGTERHERQLRALMGRREALMDSIRRRLDAADGAEAARRVMTWPPEEARTFAQVIGEVAAMDRDSTELLRARMDHVSGELRKIKDGRRWKESSRL